jgi:hypothetical protein
VLQQPVDETAYDLLYIRHNCLFMDTRIVLDIKNKKEFENET